MVDQASRLDDILGAPAPQDGEAAPGAKPRLADGIELHGEMKESAFAEPPWLISRNGTFLQVTEFVHHVAEQCTGDKTVEDIASAMLKNGTGQVDAAEVSQLINTSLVPTGIVTKPDGSVQEQPADGPSSLTINMKMKMLSPAFINIFTKVLGLLYLPPVLIAVLLAAAATQYWVFFVHGLGSSLHDSFYGSGMMLAVLCMVLASAAFHEFGHASGLTYGGGRVGGMGVGVYIVYPAFYTDVTDNYRLPRWSRVRTDLGGFYFNLVFGIALTGLYALTGQEVLLLGIAIIDFEIIHQTLPFIRLDGYWALADISGIPDFFSQIAPFIRSQVPSWVPFPKGRELPPLKIWARIFFICYILVTGPLLFFLFFLMFRALPRIIATGASAFWENAHKLPGAATDLDIVTLLASSIQMVLLALPSIGACYLFLRLASKFVRGIWKWSEPSLARRAVGTLAMAAAAALFVYLWIPQIGLPAIGKGENRSTALASRFQPIEANERFTVPDAIRQRPVMVPPANPPAPRQGGGDEQPAGAPGVTATPDSTSTPQPSLGLTPGAGSTPVRTTPAVQTPAVGATPRPQFTPGIGSAPISTPPAQ